MKRISSLAEWRIRLNIHPLHAAAIGDLINIERCQLQLNRLVHITERKSHRLGLDAVDGDQQLLGFRQRVGPGAGKHRTFVRIVQQQLLRFRQLRARLSGARLQVHVHPAEAAESADGGQIDYEDLCIADVMQNAVGLGNELHGRA